MSLESRANDFLKRSCTDSTSNAQHHRDVWCVWILISQLDCHLSSQATPFSCTVKSTKVISSHIFVPDTMISDAKSWSWFICAPHSRALQIVQSNHSARTHFQFQSKLNSQKWCQDRLDQVHQECVGDWSSDPDAGDFLMQVHDRLTKHNSHKNSHEYVVVMSASLWDHSSADAW